MSEASYALMLRNLSHDYYHNHIDIAEYRSQRKIILDKIDKELNGAEAASTDSEVDETTSIFMQTIGFSKNTDIKS